MQSTLSNQLSSLVVETLQIAVPNLRFAETSARFCCQMWPMEPYINLVLESDMDSILDFTKSSDPKEISQAYQGLELQRDG